MRTFILFSFVLFLAFMAINAQHKTQKRIKNTPVDLKRIQSNNYIIYSPDVIYAGNKFRLYILILRASKKTTVKLYVNNRYKKKRVVRSGYPRIITTRLRKAGLNRIKIVARGGVRFTKITKVYYINKRRTVGAIFFQMDKFIYQPLDTVRFRCFALSGRYKTLNYPLDIKVYDPMMNLIFSWRRQRSRTGVISKSLKLSDLPNTRGKWKILIKQRRTGLKGRQSFMVRSRDDDIAKAVMNNGVPLIYVYQLRLSPSSYLEQYVNLVIKGYYNNGIPIVGRLMLWIRTKTKRYTRVFKINGEYNYKFQLKEFIKGVARRNLRMWKTILCIRALVIDSESKFYVWAKKVCIKLLRYPLKMIAPKIVVQKLGLRNKFNILIRRIAWNYALKTEDIKGKVYVTFFMSKKSIVRKFCIPYDGYITVDLPYEFVKKIKVVLKGYYQKFQYKLTRTLRVEQYNRGSPQLDVISANRRYYAGDTIYIRLKCTAVMLRIYYTIILHNCPIWYGTRQTFGHKTTIGIKSYKPWAPGVKILFTVIVPNRAYESILVDSVVVPLELKFRYEVGAKFFNPVAKAGSNVTAALLSAKKSTMYTMSHDYMTEFYGKNFIISKELIIKRIFGPLTNIFFLLNEPNYCNLYTLLRWNQLNLISNIINIGPKYFCRQKAILPSKPPKRPKLKSCRKYDQNVYWMQTYFAHSNDKFFTFQVPNESREWKTNGFAVHRLKGISILKEEAKFFTYKKGCIFFHLPQCMFLNERLHLKVYVYNYFSTLNKIDVYFLDKNLLCPGNESRISIEVPYNKYRTVYFPVCANSFGNKTVTIVLKANREIIDKVADSFYVKPIGRPEYFSQQMRLPLGTKRTFRMKIPGPRRDEVKGSRKIVFLVTGDIMSFILSSLDNLVILPTECGEQVANIFSWNINVHYYLKGRRSLTTPRRRKIRELVKFGYQNQLRYQKRDGSYKIFRKDRRGNIWVTAKVCQNFVEAIKKRIGVLIDERKLWRSLRFLIRKQQKSGAYREIGRITHPKLQGRLRKSSKSLTAYVLISLLSIRRKYWRLVRGPIRKAAKYLKQQNIFKVGVYPLSLMFCAFVKKRDWYHFWKIERVLLRRAKKENNMIYWEGKYSVEQTCYVLLAYSYKPNNRIVKKIVNWILSQTNEFGGFSNTQNTAVCVEALSRFGLRLFRLRKAKIIVRTDKAFKRTYRFNNQKNLLRLRASSIDSRTRNVLIDLPLKRPGMAVFKLSWFLTLNSDYDDKFGLSVSVNVKTKRSLTITICYKWNKPINPGLLYSDVQLPSGYIERSVTCSGRPCDKRNKCSKADRCVVKTRDMKFDCGLTLYLEQVNRKKPFCVDIKAAPHFIIKNRRNKFFVTTTSYFTGERCIKHYRI